MPQEPQPSQGLSGLRMEISTDEKIKQLCDRLQAIHGELRVSRESGGLHVNFACPKCLDQYGRRELRSKHFAFNLDKYFRTGKWKPKIGVPTPKGYAQCMKEHGSFSVAQLLEYAPITERGFPDFVCRPINFEERPSTEVDAFGRIVPLPPGKCIPVDQLPYDHPCSEMLRERDYDPILLAQQFKASFCDEGRLEALGEYEAIPAHMWRNTAQGRLIFESWVFESRIAWQARVVQVNGRKLHPYAAEWVDNDNVISYQTGKGSLRNRQLCGYDAAISNILPGDTSPFCVLTEGPFDAARFPRNGLAILGKYLSREQALLVRVRWPRAILAFDAGSDASGAMVSKQATEMLMSVGVVVRDFWRGSEYDRDQISLKNVGKVDCGEKGYVWCREQLERVKNF